MRFIRYIIKGKTLRIHHQKRSREIMNYPIRRVQQCPNCADEGDWIKAGKNPSGSQIYKCKSCGKKHTPRPKEKGYSVDMRRKAFLMYQRGMSYRAIAQSLDVNHQTVANWINSQLNLH